MREGYYIYILTNFNNTVIYVGVTNNLIRRDYEHKNKLTPGFTSRYHIDKLAYYEKFETAIAAISREK